MSKRGVNKVILIGNVGKDPDIKATNNGSTIANISVATSESWKDKSTGQQQERTEWHRVVFFGRLAEIVRDYLKQGSKVYIESVLNPNYFKKDTFLAGYKEEAKFKKMKSVTVGSIIGFTIGYATFLAL